MNAWRSSRVRTRAAIKRTTHFIMAHGSKARPYEIPTGSIPRGSNSSTNDVETWPQILRNGREDTPTGADSSPVNALPTIRRVSDCPLLCLCALKCTRPWGEGLYGRDRLRGWDGVDECFSRILYGVFMRESESLSTIGCLRCFFYIIFCISSLQVYRNDYRIESDFSI